MLLVDRFTELAPRRQLQIMQCTCSACMRCSVMPTAWLQMRHPPHRVRYFVLCLLPLNKYTYRIHANCSNCSACPGRIQGPPPAQRPSGAVSGPNSHPIPALLAALPCLLLLLCLLRAATHNKHHLLSPVPHGHRISASASLSYLVHLRYLFLCAGKGGGYSIYIPHIDASCSEAVLWLRAHSLTAQPCRSKSASPLRPS